MSSLIVIADDQPSALLGLQAVLRPLGHSVVTAASPDATLALLENQAPAALVVGFFTDGAGLPGIELLTRLAERPARPPTLVRAPGIDPHLRVGLARLGVAGLVDTSASGTEVCAAVETLLSGGTHFDPVPPEPKLLTGRPLAILQLLACGLPQKQVAAKLGMAAVTLHHHLAEARRRFQAANTAALVASLVARRILHLPPWTLERQTDRRAGGRRDGGTAARRDGGKAGRREGGKAGRRAETVVILTHSSQAQPRTRTTSTRGQVSLTASPYVHILAMYIHKRLSWPRQPVPPSDGAPPRSPRPIASPRPSW